MATVPVNPKPFLNDLTGKLVRCGECCVGGEVGEPPGEGSSLRITEIFRVLT